MVLYDTSGWIENLLRMTTCAGDVTLSGTWRSRKREDKIQTRPRSRNRLFVILHWRTWNLKWNDGLLSRPQWYYSPEVSFFSQWEGLCHSLPDGEEELEGRGRRRWFPYFLYNEEGTSTGLTSSCTSWLFHGEQLLLTTSLFHIPYGVRLRGLEWKTVLSLFPDKDVDQMHFH